MRRESLRELIAIVTETRALLARPSNDFAWSGWRDQDHALAEIDGVIELLERGSVPRLRLTLLFAPTGDLQEVSLSGWATEFLELAKRLDLEIGAPGS